jgi:hypothetical protein
MPNWLADNEKFALIALEARVDQHIPLQELSSAIGLGLTIRSMCHRFGANGSGQFKRKQSSAAIPFSCARCLPKLQRCSMPRRTSPARGRRSPRATRRHLTGRNHQFNAKATADTIRRFNAICDGQRWVAGLALEHLVALGEAALRDGTIAEAIDALEKSSRARA